MLVNYSVFFLLFVALLVFYLEKTIVNPISMFFSLWALILFLSNLRLFSLFKVSDRIYNMILLGLLSFGIGYLMIRLFYRSWIAKKKFERKDTLNNKVGNIEYEIRYKLVYILCGIAILFHLKEMTVVLQYLFSGNSLAYIRTLAQDNTSSLHAAKSGFENALKIFIVTPLTGALQPVVATDFFIGSRNKKLFIINIVILTLRVLTDGSRTYVIYFAICLIIAFFFSVKKPKETYLEKTAKNKKRNYLIFSLLIIALVVMIYFVTASRSGEYMGRYAYYYFSMQPIMFEKWANIVDVQKIHGYGVAATNGFSFAVMYLLSSFLRIPYPDFWQKIYNLIEGTGTNWQVITTQGTSANSFVSAFWVLYLDGRLIGIVIGMLIYGCLVAITFSKAKYTKSSKSISVYAIVYLGLFYTFVRFQFANVFYAMTFIYVVMVMYKKKRRINI